MTDEARTSRLEALAEVESESHGGGGGEPFADAQGVIDTGGISKIEIRSGKEIDGFRLYYGDGSGIGEWHGGEGGTMQTFELSQGETIVRVEGRAGKRVDALQFFTNAGRSSPSFGGGGGKPFTVGAVDGKYLRTISGRANKRIDQVTLEFGLPFYIDNFQYDTGKLPERISGRPEILSTVTIKNAGSSVPQHVSQTFAKTLSASKKFTFKAGQRALASTTFQTKVPFVVNGKIKLDLEARFEEGRETTNIQSQTHTFKVDIAVPADRNMVVKMVGKMYEIKALPFTYDVIYYDGSKDRVVERITHGGTYDGVNYAEFGVDYEETDPSDSYGSLENLRFP